MADGSSNRRRGLWFKRRSEQPRAADGNAEKPGPAKWSMGVLNDRHTVEVPGSVLLLARDKNEPLGLRNQPARTSHSSIPAGVLSPTDVTHSATQSETEDPRKTTKDGKIILEPQPEDSANDPLNWPTWRRDSALLSLGLYCMVGGGITPILAAGFTNVSQDFDVPVTQVALTTGLYMFGLGIGSVIFSPTAILYGKRPVYLFSVVLFILSSVWCALSTTFTSLILARIFQGISVSPVECLPSATIAEIFFLHERAFRIGIYTLLLLGGKNLTPLVAAAIIQSFGWRWVFWIVAFVVATCGVLLFLFVPETFWDRAPHAKKKKSSSRSSRNFLQRLSRLDSHNIRSLFHGDNPAPTAAASQGLSNGRPTSTDLSGQPESSPVSRSHKHKNVHVGFALDSHPSQSDTRTSPLRKSVSPTGRPASADESGRTTKNHGPRQSVPDATVCPWESEALASLPNDEMPSVDRGADGTGRQETARNVSEVDSSRAESTTPSSAVAIKSEPESLDSVPLRDVDLELAPRDTSAGFRSARGSPSPAHNVYTHSRRQRPALTFLQQLKPFNGRLNHDNWLKVAVRPFILFTYPGILWSAAVYSLSVGWLIVLSECVAIIYRNRASYNFNAFQVGLIYLSPFIGGVLGTAVAGKVSDIIVKAMARRNGGLYEPEFRLVMALPVALTTAIGLMGFGWSAQERDAWIVPTVFFGLTSFGCSLGSTTSITFCVDSYRQYAGEALVTLNFSKNIFHGLVFSLFITDWLQADGAKSVFIWLGVMQVIVLLTSIPLYLYGKRARMWTVRKNLVERATSGKFKKVHF